MAQDQEIVPSKWPDLLPDLLDDISKRLYDTFDAIRIRAVCRSWHSAMPLTNHAPQLPFLLSDNFMLYSLHTGQTRRLHVPEAQGKLFFGQQSNGHLVTYGRQSFSDLSKPFTNTHAVLLNPFTRDQLLLPFDDFSFYSPIFISKDAIKNNDADVIIHMSSHAKGHCLGFRDNANDWHCKDIFEHDSIAFYKGRLFIFDYRAVFEYNWPTLELVGKWLPVDAIECHCLVESADSLLAIVRSEEHSFEVYQLNEEMEPSCWYNLSNIGDQMIFLNRNQGFSLSANSFNGIRGNCIYFTSWNGKRGHGCRTDILRYDLGNRSTEVVGTSMQLGGTWIVPNVY